MQGTGITDELLKHFERDQHGSNAIATGVPGNSTLKVAQDSGTTTGPIAGVKLSKMQQTVKIIDFTG